MLGLHSVDSRVPFVGRESELNRLFALFEYGGALTLVGPGGVGKSRLALQAALHYERDRARPVIFAALAGVASDSVAGTLAAAIGAREQVGRTAIDVIREELREQPYILVLDNCEHVPDEAGALIEALQAIPSLAIVATSQRRLDYSDERVLDVAPFDIATGTAFFSARAQSANITLSSEELMLAGAIVERLDGLAVAIDLAAARLASLSVRELSLELEQLRPYQFRSGANRDPRHRTIGKVVDWSVSQLDPESYRAFAVVSLFANTFNAQDVAAVLGRTEMRHAQAESALCDLADRSLLLRSEDGRFSMLSPIRAVAARNFSSMPERHSIEERFAQYMNEIAGRLHRLIESPEPGDAASQLAAHYDDFCTALEWALKRPALRLALVIDIATTAIAIWADGARFTEGTRWMERLLQASRHLPGGFDTRLIPAAMRIAHAAGDYLRMLELGASSISAFSISGDRLGLARSYNALAIASLYSGRVDDAETFVQTAISLYEAVDHRRGVGAALINHGNIALEGRSNPVVAQERYERALGLLLQTGPDTLIGIAYGNMAEAAYFSRDPVSGEIYALRAIERLERHRNDSLTAWDHELIARCRIVQHDLQGAKSHLLTALKLLARAPQPTYLAQALETGVRLLIARSHFAVAAPLSFAAQRLRRERCVPHLGPSIAEVRADEARLDRHLGAEAMQLASADAEGIDLSLLPAVAAESIRSA